MTKVSDPFEQLALKRKAMRWLKANPDSEISYVVEACVNGIDPFELTRAKEVKYPGKKPKIDKEDYWAIWTVAYKTSSNKLAIALICDRKDIRKFITSWAFEQFMSYESFMSKKRLTTARTEELNQLAENNFNEAIQLLKDKYGMGQIMI
jgi:hypothetical protein